MQIVFVIKNIKTLSTNTNNCNVKPTNDLESTPSKAINKYFMIAMPYTACCILLLYLSFYVHTCIIHVSCIIYTYHSIILITLYASQSYSLMLMFAALVSLPN